MITAEEARELTGPTVGDIQSVIDALDTAIRSAATAGKHQLRLGSPFWSDNTTKRWGIAKTKLEDLGYSVDFDDSRVNSFVTIIKW